MFERSDRRIEGSNKVLFVLIIVISAVAFGGLYFWSRMDAPEQPLPLPVPVPTEGAPSAAPETPVQAAVMAYFPSGGRLVPERIMVPREFDAQSQAREAVASLLTHKQAWQSPVLKNLRLAAFYLDTSGSAYVDLTAAAKEREFRGSIGDEMLAIYSIVNTLTQNFEEVKQVHFLFEGRELETLAGHVDLSEYFRPRGDLVRQ